MICWETGLAAGTTTSHHRSLHLRFSPINGARFIVGSEDGSRPWLQLYSQKAVVKFRPTKKCATGGGNATGVHYFGPHGRLRDRRTEKMDHRCALNDERQKDLPPAQLVVEKKASKCRGAITRTKDVNTTHT